MKSKMPTKKVAVNSLASNKAVNLNSLSNANQQMLGNQIPQMQMQMPIPQVQNTVQTSTPIPPPVRSVQGGVYGARRNVAPQLQLEKV